ncbi:alpha-D-ribose 1-methylphosphonate 5-triphosphate diphosphatase [Vreelandella venusta]|uniref:Alpha-D-ribose 1-methylphosphonate 5-triphosphate diphosphatase n=1 Tax=Vreelandella venusta TaxID=44935 RepID=A0AAQ0CI13_9GAMM|nr:alpha-D-ribose 1-methylphosphonate 5-triphosphate diphosphatase [Halomonas venusta]MDW0360777.1 alpha-D-ribose 1-methylphosphonate 5-triphosphate diphosphatase [Halomonas venusta]QPI64590.1 alpha-D-ribose 1-methylphosphonate 5-triphosphate diphosphatase [Halomonas venusta]QRL03787.1 alpha-D-ribose 1-methylphosphonate 5-triphosphate diphosphatase [Halomonas venusta]UQI41125.1 alpha-D-ribose 1-methylphosphonate 5-triphosphate diphosphatase [Halomonas venusta]WAM56028.1 alpha-D-ribose 1-methyl
MGANNQILTNARLVLEDDIVHGSLVIKDGMIMAVERGLSTLPGAIDCAGDLLIPGLIELHTDNMEKYFQPRPKVSWPPRSAALAHDAQMAASGITTVFDAVSIGDVDDHSMRQNALHQMVEALTEINRNGMARVDHRLHLRCEVCHPDTLARFQSLADTPELGLVSLMDHSPGQRQFASFDAYRVYYKGKHGFDDASLDAFIERQQGFSTQYSSAYRKAISQACHERGLALASHDDATVEHVAESLEYGTKVAEFPTTLEAAKASHKNGMAVMMGAPNVVRGGSHSGNIAASELVRHGVLDILSSDYYPAALLDAVFQIAAMEGGYDLPRAVACASRNPAKAVGFDDRGRISEGLRADLIRVREVDGHPLVQRVWCAGKQVH